MDWILFFKIISVIVAATLGIFGIIYEHRKDGKLTTGGKLTIAVILLASTIAGILEGMTAADSQKQMQKTINNL